VQHRPTRSTRLATPLSEKLTLDEYLAIGKQCAPR